MMKIEVFDPAMCCTSGVCGPTVDPALATFAATLDGLKKQGATVVRYNLAQEPAVFAQHDTIRAALTADENCLPIILIDGVEFSRGQYPEATALSAALGLNAPTSDLSEVNPCGGETASTQGGCC